MPPPATKAEWVAKHCIGAVEELEHDLARAIADGDHAQITHLVKWIADAKAHPAEERHAAEARSALEAICKRRK